MSFFDPYEHEQPDRSQLTEKAARIKDNISPTMIANHLGARWDRDKKKIVCPNHKGGREKTPSLMVYSDHFFCHACGKWHDVISYAATVMGIPWSAAIDELIEQFDIIMTENKRQEVYYPTGDEYRGPAPQDLAYYWHSALTPERREWLYEKRLLTDETIDEALIGWRTDYNAYSIPFWRGQPQKSEIDIIQYRWVDHPKGIRYTGMRGHNRPSIINCHRLGSGSAVLLFGTFDALLCAQDGVAAISTNGASAFMRNEENLKRLRKLLHGCVIYIMPDRVEDEIRSAHLLAGAVRGQVRHFPELQGKDYTEMRLAGNSPGAILGEAVMGKEHWLIKDDADDKMVLDLLGAIVRVDETEVLELLSKLEQKYPVPVINQHLQVRMQFDPYMTISHETWEILRKTITNKLTAERLTLWVKESVELVYRSKGGF
jgi:hypothetical protein